jgi:hypothetical protein
MIKGLKFENLVLRNTLLSNCKEMNKILLPAFKFGNVNKNNDPKGFYAGLVLNKLYSNNVSLENLVMSNDVFMVNCLYRYTYEMYIKTFSIFNYKSDEKTISSLVSFFNSKEPKIRYYFDSIEKETILINNLEEHLKMYKMLSSIAHPNIESLNLHYNKDPNEQFIFLRTTSKLMLGLEIEIILLFQKYKIINLEKNLNSERVRDFQKKILME